MEKPSNISASLKRLAKPATLIYPLIIIVSIPILLIINTLWNLKSFNRDSNFIVRHQAISTADTLKPFVIKDVDSLENLNSQFINTVDSNPDIISIVLLYPQGKDFVPIAYSSSKDDAQLIAESNLNKFVEGEQSFAALEYDPKLSQNVWNVAVPIEIIQGENSSTTYVLSLKMDTKSVDEILNRTSKDSLIILAVLILVTLILLANHFIFYRKAIYAQQLAEIDRLKDEFFSMASHELRAPITGFIGYLDLVKDKIPSDIMPKIKPDLDVLNSISLDLRDLVNDLLEVSRIEQGRFKINIQETNVGEIINHVVETMKPLASQKNLTIESSVGDLPQIHTDPDRLRQILTNLVNNSVKYTLKGKITVSAQVNNKEITVKVSDTGIGIPADQLPKLFTKFHRVKSKETKEVTGTGLGLWITKRIVELLGGKIYAESIFGTGSSFIFTLPIR